MVQKYEIQFIEFARIYLPDSDISQNVFVEKAYK